MGKIGGTRLRSEARLSTPSLPLPRWRRRWVVFPPHRIGQLAWVGKLHRSDLALVRDFEVRQVAAYSDGKANPGFGRRVLMCFGDVVVAVRQLPASPLYVGPDVT
jgi:hypothetical protein